MKAFSMLSSGFVVRSKRSYLLLVCLAACCASGLRLKAQILTREDLQSETATYEVASRSAEPPQMPAGVWFAYREIAKSRIEPPEGLQIPGLRPDDGQFGSYPVMTQSQVHSIGRCNTI